MDWSKRVIKKLPKKEDLKNCDSWRGIMLLSIPSKVLCKVILNRIDKQIDTKLREEKAGFRAWIGCIDQIFIFRTDIKQCAEFNKPLQVNFVDFLKALNCFPKIVIIDIYFVKSPVIFCWFTFFIYFNFHFQLPSIKIQTAPYDAH